MPTLTKVRDLTAGLFTGRAAQGPLAGETAIEFVHKLGHYGLLVTFTDHTRALITITTHDSPREAAS
jgi:hypothetical protein